MINWFELENWFQGKTFFVLIQINIVINVDFSCSPSCHWWARSKGSRLAVCIQKTLENIKDCLQTPNRFLDNPICSTQNSKKWKSRSHIFNKTCYHTKQNQKNLFPMDAPQTSALFLRWSCPKLSHDLNFQRPLLGINWCGREEGKERTVTS